MDNNSKTERGVEHMQTDLFEHFASYWHNGFLKDCTMTLITTITDPTRILLDPTSFCMLLVFAGRYFPTGYNVVIIVNIF